MGKRRQPTIVTTRRWFIAGAALTAFVAATRKGAALWKDTTRQVIRTPVPEEPTAQVFQTEKGEVLDDPLDAGLYGARGDGISDDTSAIQNAMIAATTEQRPLVLRAGRYLVSRPLYAPSNLDLYAHGATLVTMIPELGNAGRIVATVMIDGVSDIRITGLTIDGRKDFFEHTEFKAGICLHSATNVEIRDCELYDCKGDGLICFSQFADERNRNLTVVNTIMRGNYRLGCAITDLVGGRFVGCRFTGNTGTAPMSGVDIEPHDGAAWIDDILFEHCDFSGNGSTDVNTGAGVLVALVPGRTSPQGNIRFVDCVMSENATMGALLLEAEDVLFERCGIRRNGDAGLALLSTAAGIVVSGGTITHNAHFGVRVEMLDGESLANLTLSGIEITDNSQESEAEYDGVNLVGWCREVTIADCQISGTHRYGVWVDQAVEGLTLSDNRLDGNAVGPVYPEHLLEMNQT